METYSDQLQRELDEINIKYPYIPEMIENILKIKSMSTMEFDYEIERKHLMTKKLVDIIEKYNLIRL